MCVCIILQTWERKVFILFVLFFVLHICHVLNPLFTFIPLDKFDKKKRSAFDEAILEEDDSLDNLSTGLFLTSSSNLISSNLISFLLQTHSF